MQISVVIPTLNEADWIGRCLEGVRVQPGRTEVVVVDGGSTDGTLGVPMPGARLVHSSPGRATQMNVGARLCGGDVLLFLHADTLLHPEALAKMRQVLADPKVVGGTFTLRFDDPHPVLRFYGWCTNLPFHWLRYGDQGIFVRRTVFDRLHGFRELPLLEDVDFLRRLRIAGRAVLIRRPVLSSARRFLERGILRQQIVNTAILAAHAMGLSPARLAGWFGSRRRRA